MVTGKAFDKDEVRQSAEKIIKTIGRQNRVRVKMESGEHLQRFSVYFLLACYIFISN